MTTSPIWRYLDPTRARSGPAQTTYYVPDRIVVSGEDQKAQLELLTELAAAVGWDLVPDRRLPTVRADRPRHALTRLLIVARPGAPEPDAFALLERARATRRQVPLEEFVARGADGERRRFPSSAPSAPSAPAVPDGVAREGDHLTDAWPREDPVARIALDHAVFLAAFHPNPTGMYGTNPTGMYGTNPTGMYGTNGYPPAASYVVPGAGGRSPVAVVLDGPERGEDPDASIERRPAIGIVDSGCGPHPWLVHVVRDHPTAAGGAIAPQSALTPSAEDQPDQYGPKDGVIDEVSGHGTFIAGVVHQTAPHVDIYSWRLVAGNGVISETELVAALEGIADLVAANRSDPDTGVALDVLSLSLGFYPEHPEDAANDNQLLPTVRRFADLGVAVVMSAGNESTDAPLYPAAFAAQPVTGAPVVSVGARNPNGTIALFSNIGPWVSRYELGAAVVSTSPPFEGGLQPIARVSVTPGLDGEVRETLDPDSFVGRRPGDGGFAVWSGTSFAAPRLAAMLASRLPPVLPRERTAAESTDALHAALADLDAAKPGWQGPPPPR